MISHNQERTPMRCTLIRFGFALTDFVNESTDCWS
jgi:hypothetical protein